MKFIIVKVVDGVVLLCSGSCRSAIVQHNKEKVSSGVLVCMNSESHLSSSGWSGGVLSLSYCRATQMLCKMTIAARLVAGLGLVRRLRLKVECRGKLRFIMLSFVLSMQRFAK